MSTPGWYARSCPPQYPATLGRPSQEQALCQKQGHFVDQTANTQRTRYAQGHRDTCPASLRQTWPKVPEAVAPCHFRVFTQPGRSGQYRLALVISWTKRPTKRPYLCGHDTETSTGRPLRTRDVWMPSAVHCRSTVLQWQGRQAPHMAGAIGRALGSLITPAYAPYPPVFLPACTSLAILSVVCYSPPVSKNKSL